MKKMYIIFLFNIVNYSFSQDSRLFDNYWYLTNIIENGTNNIPPTSDMGISFNQQQFNAHGCLYLGATVTFENNITNFSATNFQPCLCMCFNPPADAYETNKYFPFLNNSGYLSNISYFTYTISELSGIKTLIINSEFNKQAIYSSVMLSNDNFKKLDFSFSPNPSKDYLEINLNSEFTGNATAEFYNEIGQVCKTSHLNNNVTKIEINNLSNGIYIVKIKTENEVLTKKFIKI